MASTLGEQLRTLRARLYLDRHHGVERFGVIMAALLAVGLVATTGSVVGMVRSARAAMTDTAQYTTTFETSRTEQKGDVRTIAVSPDGRTAAVFMDFGENNQMSLQATDYRGFLWGLDRKLRPVPVATAGGEITATIHHFGTNGLMAVILHSNAEPFHQQVLNLTMRATVELVADDDDRALTVETPAANPDQSDEALNDMFDQWSVVFNPGTSGAVRSDALATDPINLSTLYDEIILAGAKDDLYARMNAQLAAMRTDLQRIDQYERDRQTTIADGLSLERPPVPQELLNDEITGQSAPENPDGVSTLALRTDHIFTGGYMFDWRTEGVGTGIVDRLKPADMSMGDFLEQQRENVGNQNDDPVMSVLDDIPWLLSDGTSLVGRSSSGDVDTLEPLRVVMNNLDGAWKDYAADKYTYQVDLMYELMVMDAEVWGAATSVTTRDDPETVIVLK